MQTTPTMTTKKPRKNAKAKEPKIKRHLDSFVPTRINAFYLCTYGASYLDMFDQAAIDDEQAADALFGNVTDDEADEKGIEYVLIDDASNEENLGAFHLEAARIFEAVAEKYENAHYVVSEYDRGSPFRRTVAYAIVSNDKDNWKELEGFELALPVVFLSATRK